MADLLCKIPDQLDEFLCRRLAGYWAVLECCWRLAEGKLIGSEFNSISRGEFNVVWSTNPRARPLLIKVRLLAVLTVCGSLAGCGDYWFYQGACFEPEFFSVDPSHGLNASAEAVQPNLYARLWLYLGAASGTFSVVIGARDDVVKSRSLLGLKCTSSKSEEDTDGICAPLEERKTATRVLLNAPSALTFALSSLSNSVTSALCSPFVSSATLPGVLDEIMSATGPVQDF